MKYTLAILLVAALFLGACASENLAGDARTTAEAREEIKPEKGSDIYTFADVDTTERMVTFVEEATGDTRQVSLDEDMENGQFVHEGQSFMIKYVRDNVLSIDIDADGSYETVVFLGNTFEVPSYR